MKIIFLIYASFGTLRRRVPKNPLTKRRPCAYILFYKKFPIGRVSV